MTIYIYILLCLFAEKSINCNNIIYNFVVRRNTFYFKREYIIEAVAALIETGPLAEHANLALPCKPCLCGIFHSLASSESKYCGCVSTFIKQS